MAQKFYENLKPLKSFIEITNIKNYKKIPEDWYVIITDVRGSTKAIEEGRYKEVNTLGACTIISVLNSAQDLEIPFIFGGDGATLLVPPEILDQVKCSLQDTIDLSRDAFDLNIRIGIVPVKRIIEGGYNVLVSKYRVSRSYDQAIFTGGGLTFAENLIKDPEESHLYLLKDDGIRTFGNFAGFECRWQDIKSKYGEIVSIIISARGKTDLARRRTYHQVISKIKRIYGSESRYHPITKEFLKLSFDSANLNLEARVITEGSSLWQKVIYWIYIRITNFWGWVSQKFRLRFLGLNFNRYQNLVRGSADYMKFDDTLRMVISGNKKQRQMLEGFLNNRFENGELYYGIHVSDRALMTCLVVERIGTQVHFVDGADGGYTVAAKHLKSQIKLAI